MIKEKKFLKPDADIINFRCEEIIVTSGDEPEEEIGSGNAGDM